MKTILTLFLFLASFYSIAQNDNGAIYARADKMVIEASSITEDFAVNRVLTSDEKATLQANPRFIAQCKQAMLDKAVYWTGQNGVNMPDSPTAIRWAKSRLYGNGLISNPSSLSNGAIVQQFIIYLKNMNLWDSAVTPFNADTVIDYMIAQSKFDTLADNVFDEQIKGIDL
jgi:hypothetical protein